MTTERLNVTICKAGRSKCASVAAVFGALDVVTLQAIGRHLGAMRAQGWIWIVVMSDDDAAWRTTPKGIAECL